MNWNSWGIILFSAVVILTLPCAYSKSPLPPEGKVFQLITQSVSDNKKQYYSSAFVVDAAGILVTPYHSLAQAIAKPETFQLQLKVSNTIIPARLFAFDATSDIALIQVSHKFIGAYLLSSQLPFNGDKVRSIGMDGLSQSNTTQIDCVFNEQMQSGPLVRYLISVPLDRPMSDSIVVNTRGELMGISNKNLLPFRNANENYSLFTPGSQIAELLRRGALSNRKPASRQPAEDIVNQVDFTLAPWLKEWKSHQWVGTIGNLDRFQLADPASNIKCVEDKTESNPGLRRITCSNGFSFPISQQKEGGMVTINYSLVSNETRIPTSRALQLKQTSANNFEKSNGNGDEKIKYVCHHRYVNTQQKFPVLAEFCMSPVDNAIGFYNFLLTATTALPGNSLLAELNLQGFTLAGIKLATESFLNGMRDRGSQ